MSDTDRVRAWRDRLKQEGRVPMTIWVTAATKARYDDLALTYHRSPSELAQQALNAYRLDHATVADTVTDTERLRAFIRTEMAQCAHDMTATITATVTDTLMAQLQVLVQAAIAVAVSATSTDTDTVTVPVAGTGADTDTVTPGRRAGTPCVPATTTATSTDTRRTGYDPDAAFARMQTLQAQGRTLAQIAAQLTAEGVRTKQGRPWHKSTVAYVLKTHGR